MCKSRFSKRGQGGLNKRISKNIGAPCFMAFTQHPPMANDGHGFRNGLGSHTKRTATTNAQLRPPHRAPFRYYGLALLAGTLRLRQLRARFKFFAVPVRLISWEEYARTWPALGPLMSLTTMSWPSPSRDESTLITSPNVCSKGPSLVT